MLRSEFRVLLVRLCYAMFYASSTIIGAGEKTIFDFSKSNFDI